MDIVQSRDNPVASCASASSGVEQCKTGPAKDAQSRVVPPVFTVAKGLGSAADTNRFTLGCVVLCGIVFIVGAAPGYLPTLFLVFSAVALPWRIATFVARRWTPFLVDFCYFANLSAMYFLVVDPHNPRLEAMVYVLTEGPLAAALIAWQCTWLLGSADHTVSVLIHLLPGLALFSHRFLLRHTSPSSCVPPPPHALAASWGGGAGWTFLHHLTRETSRQAGPSNMDGPASVPLDRDAAAGQTCAVPVWEHRPFVWLFVAPLVFYCIWQLVYFLLIQVVFRRSILRHGYDTSYNALARRAASANSPLNALVRRGSIVRRITLYGLAQLGFTIVTSLLAAPMYFSFPLAAAWQVVKFVVPLYYGAQYQCRKVPATAFLTGIEQLALEGLVSREKLLGSAAPVATRVHATTQVSE